MPYTHRKIGDKECVFKKEDGSKVGCTTGPISDYLAALHANADVSENNILKGGKADNLTLNDLAKKFNVSVESIKNQINKGVKVELEHTDDKAKATEIAMDHLSEFPDYYDRLEKMENKASKDKLKTMLREHITKL